MPTRCVEQNEAVLEDEKRISGEFIMTRKSLILTVLGMLFLAGFSAMADTFKNKETGEVFYGFKTLKSTGNKTLIYNENEKKLIPVDLSGFEVTQDDNGRRNIVVLVSITDAEALLSETVTKIICESITKGANSGPRFILIKIDNPGGRGEYMKEICSTITNTTNCPVIAYISGGPFGGAHSAAAAIALACDKIYIAPTASMSAIGPFVSTSSGHSETDFVKTYSPDSLSSYGVYAATLAENHKRPALLSKALLDKKIGLEEVIDAEGNQSIVQKDLRLPNQTVVKTICEGIATQSSASQQEASTTEAKSSSVSDIHSRVLQLPPSEAIRLKMADGIADSIQAVLADMKAPDVQITSDKKINTTINQFVAAKRNIGQSLSRIDFLENRTATLEEQLRTIEEQTRTTPVTRTRTRSGQQPAFTRGRILLPSDDYYYYYDQPMQSNQAAGTQQQITQNNTVVYPNTSGYRTQSRSRYNRSGEMETVVTNEPSIASDQVTTELTAVLNDLIGEYRGIIALSKRWSGALPPEITVAALQRNLDSAIALSDSLRFRTQ